MYRRSIAVLFFVSLLCGVGSAQVQRRVAIVSSTDDKLTAIIEASLAGQVQLVDRAELRRVLAEQNMAGLMSPDQAVSVGRLVKADLLVSIESVDAAGYAVIGFDSTTGRRVADTFVAAEKSAEATAARLSAATKDAVDKSILPDARTVCLLTVRNADLPRQQAGLADIVGPLLERRLVDSPAVAVLERSRLDKLTKERQVGAVGDVAERLLTSVSLIELQLSRTANAGQVRALAILTDHAGKEIARTEVTASADAPGLAAAIASAVLTKLGAAAPAGNGDPVAESHRFVKEAQFLSSHADWPAAVRAMESAHALDPKNLQLHLSLVKTLADAAMDRLPEGAEIRTRRPMPDRDRQFRYMRRNLDELLNLAAMPVIAGGKHPIDERAYSESFQTLREWLNSMLWPRPTQFIAGQQPVVPNLNLTVEQAATLRESQADYRRLRLELEKPIRWSRAKTGPGLAAYGNSFLMELVTDAYYLFGRNTAEGAADAQQLLVEWLDAAEQQQLEPSSIGAEFRKALAADAWPGKPQYAPPENSAETVERIKQMRLVHAKMAKSSDLHIAATGEARLKATQEQLDRLAAGVADPTTRATKQYGSGSFDGPPPAPKIELVRGERFWDEFRVLVDTMNNDDGLLQLIAPVVRDDSVYVVGIERNARRPPNMVLLKYPLQGGEPATLRRFLVGGKPPRSAADNVREHRIRRLNERRLLRSSPATEKYLVMETTLIPFDGGKPIEISPQPDWPATQIQAITVLGETLYVALGEEGKESFLIEQPLNGGPITVLASSRRKEKQSPFDDLAPMIVTHMGVDLPRNRVLFDAASLDWEKGHSGIWEYVPATRKFRQVVSDPSYEKFLYGRRVEREQSFGPVYHDRLPIFGTDLRGALNLKTDEFEPAIRFGRTSSAVVARTDAARWTGFGRQFVGSQTIDAMPPIRPGLEEWVTWPSFMCPLDERRMLVGDNQGLFVVVPPKDVKGKPAIDSRPAPRPVAIDTSGEGVQPQQMPWTQVTMLLDFNPPDAEFVNAVAPVLSGDVIYAVGLAMDQSGTLLRVSTGGGPPTRLSQLGPPPPPPPSTRPVSTRPASTRPIGPPQARFVPRQWGWGAVLKDGYCVNWGRELAYFPFDASKPAVTVPKILPLNVMPPAIGNRVFFSDRKEYWSLKSIDFSVDPPKIETLTNDQTRWSDTPADQEPWVFFHTIEPDPDRGRLLLLVGRRQLGASENGLWSYTLATGELKKVLPLHLMLVSPDGSKRAIAPAFNWSKRAGDSLLISLNQGIIAVDLKTDTPRVLAQASDTAAVLSLDGRTRPELNTGNPLLDGKTPPRIFQPPIASHGHWLWHSAGRLSLDGKVNDRFLTGPPLSTETPLVWQAISPDGKYRYAADFKGVWRFTLKE